MTTLRKKISRTGLLLAISLFWITAATGSRAQTLLQGADAVNLKIKKHYTVNADGSYKLNLYIKRRILTYKGKKEYADFKLTYNQARQQVKLLKAVTTTVKGEVLTVKPEEVHDIPAPWNSEVSLYSRARQMVVSLPAVEPGSEIEVEIELESKNGFWCTENFRINDPIIDKTVTIDAPTVLGLQFRTPQSLKIDSQQQKISPETIRYQWQAKNIPALTPERGAPPLPEQGLSLLVSSFSTWNQVAELFVEPFTEMQNVEAANNGDELPTLKPGKSYRNKGPACHQIYREMRKLTTYRISFQETNWQIQPPATTQRLGYGTGCDLSLLFLTRLQQHKLPARIIMVCSQNHFLKKIADFPYPGWWDTALVKSGTDFFRFTDEKAAPGITGYDDRAGLDLESGKIITIKDRAANRIEQKLKLDLQNFPECQGKLTLNLYGSSASEWRSQWRNLSEPEKEIAANQFLHQIDPEAKFINKLSLTGLKDDRKNLAFRCKFKLKSAGIALANNTRELQYLLPIAAPELPFQLKSMLKDRDQPLTITDNLILDDQITIQLPENSELISFPEATTGRLPEFSWEISCKFDQEKNRVIYSRAIALKRGIIKTKTSNYRKLITTIRNLTQPGSLRVIFSSKSSLGQQ